MTHICVNKLTIIGSDNGLSPGQRQAIIWTNAGILKKKKKDAGILLTEHLRTNFSEILNEIDTFSFKKIYLQMLSGKWWPFCLGLNVLNNSAWVMEMADMFQNVMQKNNKPWLGMCL